MRDPAEYSRYGERYTRDHNAIARFIADRLHPLRLKLADGSWIGVDWSVIARLIRDGVPVDYVDKGASGWQRVETRPVGKIE